MKIAIIIGVIVAGIIGSIVIFSSISQDMWKDHRTEFTGVAPPSEIDEKIDCLSKGGLWTGNSCSVEDRDPPKAIECTGDAKCITEEITKIVDGDTIYTANYKIRLSLTNTPEKNEPGFQEATLFTAMHCPVGSMITVDQDDLQPYDIYDRMLGKVYCESGILNEILLNNGHGVISTQYCDTSEFSREEWAQNYGCVKVQESKQVPKEVPKTIQSNENCDTSYPDVCISPYPPDLDCGQIPYADFKVLQPDPHGFDRDNDGIGCES